MAEKRVSRLVHRLSGDTEDGERFKRGQLVREAGIGGRLDGLVTLAALARVASRSRRRIAASQSGTKKLAMREMISTGRSRRWQGALAVIMMW